MNIITVTNQKGGVGKTTVSVHLACGLAERGFKTLLIDLDGQGQASTHLSGDTAINRRPSGGAELVFDIEKLKAGISPLSTPLGVDLLFGHNALSRIDEGERSTTDAMDVRDSVRALPYDFIVIDTPPAMQLRQLAAVLWADTLITVIEPEEKAVAGWTRVRDMVKAANSKALLVDGFKALVLLNRVDTRIADQRNAVARMKTAVPGMIDTVLTARQAVVSTAYSSRLPIWRLKKDKVDADYAALWRDLPNAIGITDRLHPDAVAKAV